MPKTNHTQYKLEALRGFAAFFVVIHHIILHKQYLDPQYFPGKLKYLEPSGHFCVLIFFVLSGYVIGISNKKRLTFSEIGLYLKKRLLRIYPIYFISLSLALIIAVPYSLSTILSNYTITQGITGIVIWEDNPIWSLNYEVLYYLLFIVISYFEINPIIVFFSSIIIGLINYRLFPIVDIPIISGYFYGFAYWSTGLFLAKYVVRKQASVNFSMLLSGIFLILSVKLLSFNDYLLHKVTSVFNKHDLLFPGNLYWDKIIISFYDISLLPYCFLLVVLFAEKDWKYNKHLTVLLQILPLITLVNQTIKHHNEADFLWQLFPSLFYFVLSIFLYYNTIKFINIISMHIINIGIKLGAISYGIYIIHFPILVIFSKIPFFTGSIYYYTMRFIAFLGIMLVAGYFLENTVQLWIVNILKKKNFLRETK